MLYRAGTDAGESFPKPNGVVIASFCALEKADRQSRRLTSAKNDRHGGYDIFESTVRSPRRHSQNMDGSGELNLRRRISRKESIGKVARASRLVRGCLEQETTN